MPQTPQNAPQPSGGFDEAKMVRHLQDLGIDLDGFSMDGIDPIPSEHIRPGRYASHDPYQLDFDGMQA